MNAVWIVVLLIAVIVVAAFVLRRRRPPPGRELPAAGEAEAPRPEARPIREARELVAEAAAPAAESVVKGAAPPVEAPAGAEKPALSREPGGVESAVAGPAPPKPLVSDEELQEGVETRLADSERMLAELRQVTARAGDELLANVGSVEIMEEGLQEVRVLAERKQWGQAKNKGEALHAQLSLLLQSARREAAS